MAKSAIQLLDFPDEILASIAENVDNGPDLYALSLVCSRFRDLAEPRIFHTLTLVRASQFPSLDTAIPARTRRASWVRRLAVAPRYPPDAPEFFVPQLPLMQNLVHLFLESPFSRSYRFAVSATGLKQQAAYAKVFKESSLIIADPALRLLPCLRSCKRSSDSC